MAHSQALCGTAKAVGQSENHNYASYNPQKALRMDFNVQVSHFLDFRISYFVFLLPLVVFFLILKLTIFIFLSPYLQASTWAVMDSLNLQIETNEEFLIQYCKLA